jgi:DNA polymerase-3 subunit epsilon
MDWKLFFPGAAQQAPRRKSLYDGFDLSMPSRVAFVDIETTGIRTDDRIVSLGIICLNTEALADDRIEASISHLIFDPGRRSHPKAEEVHGFDDWTLRHQDKFADHADAVAELLSRAEQLVAHNASFDVAFINRELEAAGKQRLSMPVYCTMEATRDRGLVGSASLSNLCGRIGIVRQSDFHGALEDAWIAMQLYLLLHRRHAYRMPFSSVENAAIMNFREPPPRPKGRLPKRKRAAFK